MLVVAFKSYKTRTRWYANAAAIDLEIQRRAVKTKSCTSPFHYFDGATMVSYQVPTKPMEIAHCRQEPIPEECQDGRLEFDPEYANVPERSFEVRKSEQGDNAGRGVFTKVNILEGSYLTSGASSYPIRFPPPTTALIVGMDDKVLEAKRVSRRRVSKFLRCEQCILGKLACIVLALSKISFK